MRVVLGQLAKLAETLNLAVVMIAHLNKAPGADPYLRINGVDRVLQRVAARR